MSRVRVDPIYLVSQLADIKSRIKSLKAYVSQGNETNKFDLVYQDMVETELALNRAFNQAQDADYSR